MLNALFLQIEDLGAKLVDPGFHLAFLIERGFVCRFQRRLDRRDLRCELAIDFLDLARDLHHCRIARLEGLELLLIVPAKVFLPGSQILDGAVRE